MAQVVGGRYHLIAHLGGASISEVSLAKTDSESAAPRLCVVKRLKLGADAEAETVAHFAGEARMAKHFKNPNVVEALDAGEDKDGPYLVLEYLEGQTLARVRSRSKRKGNGIPRAIAIHIVGSVASGLAYAHELADESGKPLRIVHRDVSPENIVVTYSGVTKLIDFKASVSKSDAVAIKPSVAYMAPEQANSAVALDARADVFAAGVILWELLAGRRLWEGMSEAGVLARLADDKPLPKVSTVVPDMPQALDDICAKALAKVRDDRYDTAAELRDALAKVAIEMKATTAQVAELVASLFEDEREKMRTTVEEALVRPASGHHPLPQLRPLPPTSSNKFVDVETDPKLWIGVGPNPADAVPAEIVVPPPPAPSPDRRFAIAIVGMVLVAFAVVAVVAIQHKGDKEPTETPALTARPTSSEGPLPSATDPQEVTVDVIVRPLNAKLFVDGVKASNPYRTKVAPGRFMHELRAEADGFETKTFPNVQFDRDRSFDIALVPKKPTFGGGSWKADAASAPDAQ